MCDRRVASKASTIAQTNDMRIRCIALLATICREDFFQQRLRQSAVSDPEEVIMPNGLFQENKLSIHENIR